MYRLDNRVYPITVKHLYAHTCTQNQSFDPFHYRHSCLGAGKCSRLYPTAHWLHSNRVCVSSRQSVFKRQREEEEGTNNSLLALTWRESLQLPLHGTLAISVDVLMYSTQSAGRDAVHYAWCLGIEKMHVHRYIWHERYWCVGGNKWPKWRRKDKWKQCCMGDVGISFNVRDVAWAWKLSQYYFFQQSCW